MVCGNCGAQLREDSKFCPMCGQPVAISPKPYVQQGQQVGQMGQQPVHQTVQAPGQPGEIGQPVQSGGFNQQGQSGQFNQSGVYSQQSGNGQTAGQQAGTYGQYVQQSGPAGSYGSAGTYGSAGGYGSASASGGYGSAAGAGSAGGYGPAGGSGTAGGSGPVIEQKQTFVVRRMPIIVIIVLTIGLTLSAVFMEDSSMTLAAAVSSVPGIVLLFLIYRLDNIEPEPVGLLVKLFLCGGLIATVVAGLIEMVLDGFINILFGDNIILYCLAEAFILAAATEELCKYTILKFLTWKHPAFNYRFDGVVYSTAVAIGFEVIENLLYLIDSTAGTAFTRAAFPGHCIFGIYMGYYYGQAKNLELNGDKKGASVMRKKGVITAILIHGFYDFVCFIGAVPESDVAQLLIMLGLVLLMVILNVTAYKNIKKYAYEDKPV